MNKKKRSNSISIKKYFHLLISIHPVAIQLCIFLKHLYIIILLQLVSDITFVVVALLNCVWSTVYLESWKRRQAELAYSWGTEATSDYLEEPRAAFRVSKFVKNIFKKIKIKFIFFRPRPTNHPRSPGALNLPASAITRTYNDG